MNQLVTVQQGFLCTPLEGVWSMNLHGGLSDHPSTTFMLCTDMRYRPVRKRYKTNRRNKVVQKIQTGYLCIQSTGSKNNLIA